MTRPAAVLGTATLLCRPLRFLFDVQSDVAVLANDSDASVLGHVRLLVSISVPDARDSPPDALADLVGRFVSVRVRLDCLESEKTMDSWRVQYQLSPATESFVFPVEHTNVFRVLVTDELVTHVTTTALVFRFLPPQEKELDVGEAKETTKAPAKTPVQTSRESLPVAPLVPVLSPEEAAATRRLTEDAAIAASAAAEAAREAARAATSALEEAKATMHQRECDRDAAAQARIADERQRQEERDREIERERERERQRASAQARDATAEAKVTATAAAAAAYALEKQKYEHALEKLSDERQRLTDDAARLAKALDDKASAMTHWDQQTATTDAALEVLKRRLDDDARERDELQRRLRVLEEEKLELVRKSRACAVQ